MPGPRLSSIKCYLVGLAGSLVLRLVSRTLRWETIGLEGEKRYWPEQEPRIVALWHAHLLFMPWIYLNGRRNAKTCPRFVALISQHEDGRLIARAMKFLGVDSIAGSSSRRGREALFGLIDTLKNGNHVAITPDGPKGPARKVKAGVIRIAERSGASIYPAAVAAERSWTFGSWDRMFFPKPFSRMVLLMGREISIPSPLPAEQLPYYTQLVEDAMNELSERATLSATGAPKSVATPTKDENGLKLPA